MQLNVQATGDKKAKAGKLTLPPHPHSPEPEWGGKVWGSQALPVAVSSTGLATDLERALQQFLSLKDKLFIYKIKQTVIKTGS